MKRKELVAIVIALGIFLFVGCNYQKIVDWKTSGRLSAEVTATPTDVSTTVPTTVTTTEEPTTLRSYDFSQLRYSVNSGAVACYELKENRYLYEKNTSAHISPASLTKIVTACVALKYADPSVVYTVGDEINLVGKDSSLCFIRAGQQVTLYDLLCGMLLASGNDAAYTVAVNVARSVSGTSLGTAEGVSYFVGLMNDFAAEIGLTDSHFANPEGWDDDNQYMSLNDIVSAARYAIGLDVFREIVGKTNYAATFVSGQTVTWKNSNLMMDAASPFYVEGISGIKTGTTERAGRCLITRYTDGSHDLLIASMGNPTDEERYFSIREIIDTIKLQ